ncbi:hypothetical protein [Providencia sp. wls1914]|uniref:hypothetical protein n=1 Tax=Providencia sp. wls1914 TaxID=2675156 RepID=UPI0012B5E464|nr:hypothetical protein [Providencia sp. wls1914]
MEDKIMHHWLVSFYSNQDGVMQQHYRTYTTSKFLFDSKCLEYPIRDIGRDNTSITSVSYLGAGTNKEFNCGNNE